MCIALNVYIESYIVQHHRILLCKYGAIEINKHLHLGRYFWICSRINQFTAACHMTSAGHMTYFQQTL